MIGGAMRHDWIFDVLTDIGAYADENGLPALADQVRMALLVAELEVGASVGASDPVLEGVATAVAEKRRRAH